MTKQKNVYINCITTPPPILREVALGVVATGGAGLTAYGNVEGDILEVHPVEANTLMGSTGFAMKTAAPYGWLVPIDNTDGETLQITGGIDATTCQNYFTVGTDEAFFMKVTAVVTTLANIDGFMIGFRTLAAYADISSAGPAFDLTGPAWVDMSLLGVNASAAGAVSSYTKSAATGLVGTAATGTPIVTGTAFTFEVDVSAAGAVTYKIANAADTALSAVAFSHTAGVVLVPTILAAATGAGATNIVLQEISWGYQN